MAIYHFHVGIISRSTGRSSVAAAAYRAGEELQDERTGLAHDYTRRRDEIDSEIIAPKDAPEWVNDREQLWNMVEMSETNKNAQTAREINIALPDELSKDQHKRLLYNYVKENFADKGMVADVCIHYKGENPHAHIMLTMRPLTQEGTFGAKAKKEYMLDEKGEKIKLPSGEYKSRKLNTTDWDKPETLEKWRENWATHTNKALERANIDERVDHRSLEAQGKEKIPQIHLGPHVNAMEKKGIQTDRGNLYRKIHEFNSSKIVELNKYKELKSQIEQEPGLYKHMSLQERELIGKAEEILKKPVSHENIKEEIANCKELENKLYSFVQSVENQGHKLHDLGNRVRDLENAQSKLNEFNTLDKFINNKDYKKAQDEVGWRLKNLKEYGIENRDDFEKQLKDFQELKEKVPGCTAAINEQRANIETLNNTLKALNNAERKEVLKDYPKELQNMNYQETMQLRNINRSYGKTLTPAEVEQKYKEFAAQLDKYKSYTNAVLHDKARLETAKHYLEGYEKCKDEFDKLERKPFKIGKEYKEQHQRLESDLNNYTNRLKDVGIQDKADYEQQLNRNQERVSKLPDVEKKVSSISPGVNLLECVVKGIQRSSQEDKMNEKAQQHKLNKQLYPEKHSRKDREYGHDR